METLVNEFSYCISNGVRQELQLQCVAQKWLDIVQELCDEVFMSSHFLSQRPQILKAGQGEVVGIQLASSSFADAKVSHKPVEEATQDMVPGAVHVALHGKWRLDCGRA